MHEGHRQRMYERLLNDDKLYDHELLEILLFNAYTRTNTNPIAHDLLSAFGSLQGVFSAETEQLVAVKGVGKNVALYLKCVGAFLERMKSGSAVSVKNYADFQEYAKKRLRGLREERVEIYYLDKAGRLVYTYSSSSGSMHSAEVDVREFTEKITLVKPYGVFVAHNHLGGDSKPSSNDDDFTCSLYRICKLHGVQFYDHVIYAGDANVFSYHLSGVLDRMKKKVGN